ncbi:MAG: hypothetical protein HC836_40435 [Richelia sp. RM2_1_2]|nr:hypothetical protein [Richelia sp. RM2_1_2]
MQNKYYYQDYYVDVLLQVSSIEPEHIKDFLVSPSRVLFVGRKCAVPNIQIFQRIVEADSFNSAIVKIIDPTKRYLAEWMHGLLIDDCVVKSIQTRTRNDIRDPREDTIGGTRLVVLGTLN